MKQQQPEQLRTDVQSVEPRAAIDAVEGDDGDCISNGDWSQASLHAFAFDEDLPPKFVNYRPYNGAKLRIHGGYSNCWTVCQSLWHVAGTNGLVQNSAWMYHYGWKRYGLLKVRMTKQCGIIPVD